MGLSGIFDKAYDQIEDVSTSMRHRSSQVEFALREMGVFIVD